MAIRTSVIEKLIEAGFDAMQEVSRDEEASDSEVYSAVMTMALRSIQGCKAAGSDPRRLRAAVERMLLECADPTIMH